MPRANGGKGNNDRELTVRPWQTTRRRRRPQTDRARPLFGVTTVATFRFGTIAFRFERIGVPTTRKSANAVRRAARAGHRLRRRTTDGAAALVHRRGRRSVRHGGDQTLVLSKAG